MVASGGGGGGGGLEDLVLAPLPLVLIGFKTLLGLDSGLAYGFLGLVVWGQGLTIIFQ